MSAQADTPQVNQSLDLSDIVTFADFCREAEKRKLATRTALQWWMRYRRENGLLSSGAVVEKRANPRSKRALLFVVRPRFVEWLTNSHQHAA